jgi:hypothetical protein
MSFTKKWARPREKNTNDFNAPLKNGALIRSRLVLLSNSTLLRTAAKAARPTLILSTLPGST